MSAPASGELSTVRKLREHVWAPCASPCPAGSQAGGLLSDFSRESSFLQNPGADPTAPSHPSTTTFLLWIPQRERLPHTLPHTAGSQCWGKGTGEQLQGDRSGCGAPGMPSLQRFVRVLLEPVVRASKHPCDPSSTGKAAPTPAPSPDLSAEVSPQAWQENKEGNMSTITEITIALMHYQAQ